MKNIYLLLIIGLSSLTIQAQTTLKYSGTGTTTYLGIQAKIGNIVENLNTVAPASVQIGLISTATNGSAANYGIIGTTRSSFGSSPLTATTYVGVYGDNASNLLNVNNASVAGGFFAGKNTGSGSNAYGAVCTAEGIFPKTSETVALDASSSNPSNTFSNSVIAVRGVTNSGNSTPTYLKGLANPGGYFKSDDGQGVYATTSDGYNFPTFGKVSQAVTGYSNLTGAYVNAGVVGYAEGTGNFKMGVYGYLNGTAGTSTSSAIYAADNINATNTYAGYFIGKVFTTSSLYVGGTAQVAGTLFASGGLTTSGTKNFTIDHPLDPENKILRHASIESNEVLNQYSGNITTDASGLAIVTLPNYFETLNKDFRYQLTAIGSFSQVIIKKKISNNQFIIQSKQPKVEVSWQITGVRNDRNMQFKPFVAESEKEGNEKGKYLSPEAYGIAQKTDKNF